MAVTNKEMRRLFVLSLILILLSLAFIILKPILISIIIGLIFAYSFNPIYKRFFKIFKEKNTASITTVMLVFLIFFIPLWFLTPILIQQTFDLFDFVQNLNIRGFIESVFPTATDSFLQGIYSVVINFIGTVTSTILSSLTDLLLGLPNRLLHLTTVIFVFFFALRDQEKLKNYVSGLSPFRKDKEKILINQFKGMTSAIIYGTIFVGVLQGILTGVGLFIFGIPRALVFTIIAIFASIIPVLGPWAVWMPTSAYLFFSGNTAAAIAFTIYGAIVVSSFDNLLRPYLVSKKTGTSSAIILVGMIGGLIVFGIIGLILGPLILSYLLVLLTAYKDRTISDLFHTD